MSHEEHLTDLFTRFKNVKDETDGYLQKLYERGGFESIELAILFQSLATQLLHNTLKERAGVNDEHLKELEQEVLRLYEEGESSEALLNQVVKYSRLAGISLATLELVMKDMR